MVLPGARSRETRGREKALHTSTIHVLTVTRQGVLCKKRLGGPARKGKRVRTLTRASHVGHIYGYLIPASDRELTLFKWWKLSFIFITIAYYVVGLAALDQRPQRDCHYRAPPSRVDARQNRPHPRPSEEILVCLAPTLSSSPPTGNHGRDLRHRSVTVGMSAGDGCALSSGGSCGTTLVSPAWTRSWEYRKRVEEEETRARLE